MNLVAVIFYKGKTNIIWENALPILMMIPHFAQYFEHFCSLYGWMRFPLWFWNIRINLSVHYGNSLPSYEARCLS